MFSGYFCPVFDHAVITQCCIFHLHLHRLLNKGVGMLRRPYLSRLFLFVALTVGVLGMSLQAFAAPAQQTQEACPPSGDVKRGGELRLARPEEPLPFDPT